MGSFCLTGRSMQGGHRRRTRFYGGLQAFCAAWSLFFLALAGPVHADDLFDAFSTIDQQAKVLADEAMAAAKKAAAHPFAPPEGFTHAESFARRVSAFGKEATLLVGMLDARGGPRDLRCIYRGMAEDARRRLLALQQAKNAGAQAAILKDMAALFADAIEVTPTSPTALSDRHDGGDAVCAAPKGQAIKSLP
jgi:hypothetical protein